MVIWVFNVFYKLLCNLIFYEKFYNVKVKKKYLNKCYE